MQDVDLYAQTILQQIQLGIGGQRTYQHGPAGHMTQIDSAGNVTDLVYDAAGRLSQLLKPATSEKTDFLYDGRSYLVSSELWLEVVYEPRNEGGVS